APNVNASAEQTFTITVNAINDAPSFTLSGNPPAVDEGAGSQVVSGFATNMSPGPSDESAQTVVFNVAVTAVTSGNLTFDAPPTIDATTGELTYTATPGTSGTATVQATLVDSGSGTAPNVNASTPHTFTITVNPAGGGEGEGATTASDAALM